MGALLRQSAVADLARSGITPEDAERAGMFDVDDASSIYPEFRAVPALVIPYFEPSGAIMRFERGGISQPFCRVRYLDDPPAAGFVKQKQQRYSQPRDSGTRAYFCPLIDWPRALADADEPVIITEG